MWGVGLLVEVAIRLVVIAHLSVDVANGVNSAITLPVDRRAGAGDGRRRPRLPRPPRRPPNAGNKRTPPKVERIRLNFGGSNV